jgi:hypothetical protein
MNSRQGVFPPYRQVAGSTVGVEPRTPQKLNFAAGAVMFSVLAGSRKNSAAAPFANGEIRIGA